MAMVMVVSVRARELAAERVCVLVCESVFLCLSCWWQRLNKNARILYGIISSTCTEHIKPMCIQLDRECMCVRLRHARILCICGLYVRVYLCVCLYGFLYASGSCLCLCVPFMCMMLLTLTVDCWCWLEILQQQQRRQRPQKIQTLDVYVENKIDSGSKTGFYWAERRKRESEKTIKNHIHLKRKIQIQWISAVACCYINQNPIYLSCRRDWFNGICIDRCFITFYCSFFCSLDLISTMIEQISFQWINHFFFSAKRFNPNNFMWHAR